MTLDLASIPILDHHCHSLFRDGAVRGPVAYQRFFTESDDGVMHAEHVPNSVFFRWAIKELAGFFGCAPSPEAVLAARAGVAPPELAGRMFRDAHIPVLLIDYGYQGDETYSYPELRATLPCRVEPILRLEVLAQTLIAAHDTFEQVSQAFVAAVEAARSAGHAGLKSIVAYRTGLAIREPGSGEAEAAFAAVKDQSRRAGGPVRLAHKPLNDYFVLRALEVAERQQLPIQFHTGFGDPDLDLWWANPLHMRPLFHGGRFRHVPFVLLHASWPYVRELSYLAAMYPNVFLDVGLAVPHIAAEIPAMLRGALSLAPTSKVLFSTDAYSVPDIFWLAARWGRRGLAQVLGELIEMGAFSQAEALAAAHQILHGNSERVYGVRL